MSVPQGQLDRLLAVVAVPLDEAAPTTRRPGPVQMHAHVAFSYFKAAAALTRHPAMRALPFEMFLELGRSERYTALVRTRRHADDGTVVGLRRDLIWEIESTTKFTGFRI